MSAFAPMTVDLPPRPRLVLRVGFAGSQRLVTDAEWSVLYAKEVSDPG